MLRNMPEVIIIIDSGRSLGYDDKNLTPEKIALDAVNVIQENQTNRGLVVPRGVRPGNGSHLVRHKTVVRRSSELARTMTALWWLAQTSVST